MSAEVVWIFTASRAQFPGGVFSSREKAAEWIAMYSLTGVLTAYPLDTGVYDWAIANGFFRPKKPVDPGFAGSFTSSSQEHYHYLDGIERSQKESG
jgi:hypothetical protein